jgi:hypothetical protein
LSGIVFLMVFRVRAVPSSPAIGAKPQELQFVSADVEIAHEVLGFPYPF